MIVAESRCLLVCFVVLSANIICSGNKSSLLSYICCRLIAALLWQERGLRSGKKEVYVHSGIVGSLVVSSLFFLSHSFSFRSFFL
jgi:hypothetical protein